VEAVSAAKPQPNLQPKPEQPSRAEAPQPAKPQPSEKPAKPQQKEKPARPKREAKPSDFSNEYKGRSVVIVLAAGNPAMLRGRLEEASKYWVKLVIGQRTIYVNKAWIVSVEPVG
jgi:outer membrane biosynthesis protein TonB